MERLGDDWYVDIGRVSIAHEHVFFEGDRCDYLSGRKICGLSFAISGEAEYRFISKNKYVLSEGDVVFLPSNAAYTVQKCIDYNHFTVNFELDEAGLCGQLHCDEMLVLHTKNKSLFTALFGELCRIWREKKSGYEMRAVRYVYDLMIAFVEECNETYMERTPNYRRLLPAKEYIDLNFSKNMSISELAELCNMSDTNFRRRFAEVFGMAAMEYRDGVRLLHAKEFLLSGYYSVSETAEKCGFEDVSYFCRFFKKHTGMTALKFMTS